jgi:glycosyltransferase involved in cell wall biosynthesis
MANQCEQLVRLLRQDGASVSLVCSNAPYRPLWVARVPVVRAVFRLLPYLVQAWRAVGGTQVVHLLANSGWAWHLFAAPVLLIGRLRRKPVIVNYRGGLADEFLGAAPSHVLGQLRSAALRVTPSAYLRRVFGKYGLDAEIIPNIVDLSRFVPRPARNFGDAPHLVVARNLESIYDIPTALRAFVCLRDTFPQARLTVAGVGPELQRLQELAQELNVAAAVHFPGRIDNASMPALYAAADCTLNPSTVDNMPNSVLEAFASGVPVVSTAAGGVPDIISDGESGLLVPVADPTSMACAATRVLEDRELAKRLVAGGLREAEKYSWPRVRGQWLAAYRRLAANENSS